MTRSAPTNQFDHIDAVWLDQIGDILSAGETVSPRGKLTRELRHSVVHVDTRYPVLRTRGRGLNYKFMAAEAYWILTGDNTVDGIAPWNKNIAQFSDDGNVFAGAYGPRTQAQLDHVVATLINDIDTRQAGLTIWQPCPPASKDIPCTVAIWFQLRSIHSPTNLYELHSSVFMRSSDAWLGLPYDVFNFSMLDHLVCCRLNAIEQDKIKGLGPIAPRMRVVPGMLSMTLASSHLYEQHFRAAAEVLTQTLQEGPIDYCHETPLHLCENETELLETLKLLRDTKPGDTLRWWDK